MGYRIEGIRLKLEDDEKELKQAVAKILGLSEELISGIDIVRRAIDARKNRPPVAVYIVDVETSAHAISPLEKPNGVTIKPATAECLDLPVFLPANRKHRPVIAGCGPAGLFAALAFVRHGIPVLLLERGRIISERTQDVAAFWHQGILDPDSHVQFGEGGAGTFSDGKLTSRVKNPLAGWVKRVFVEMGAPETILTDGKPHIGTDRLRHVITNLRKHLVAEGCEVRFRSKMTDILMNAGKVAGVVINGKEEIKTDCLLLAVGQSADDTYDFLHSRGIHLEPKPFAMGLRVEHPQELISAIQYGPWVKHPKLPPAEYFLTAGTQDGQRSIYTFCMCPGGQVIGSSARPGSIVTNGMSNALRDGLYANSAAVVSIRTEDFLDEAASPLSGLAFRSQWEHKAFILGGKDYKAPAERLIDFLSDKASPEVGETTFMPGVCAAPLEMALPPFVALALKEGLKVFGHKMPGFVSGEANLIGVETRTSSPVRITRGADGQSINTVGIYPCGEGAGYAGGIISSALDGIRAAQRAVENT